MSKKEMTLEEKKKFIKENDVMGILWDVLRDSPRGEINAFPFVLPKDIRVDSHQEPDRDRTIFTFYTSN